MWWENKAYHSPNSHLTTPNRLNPGLFETLHSQTPNFWQSHTKTWTKYGKQGFTYNLNTRWDLRNQSYTFRHVWCTIVHLRTLSYIFRQARLYDLTCSQWSVVKLTSGQAVKNDQDRYRMTRIVWKSPGKVNHWTDQWSTGTDRRSVTIVFENEPPKAEGLGGRARKNNTAGGEKLGPYLYR